MKHLYVTPIIAATTFLVTSCGTRIQVAIAYKGYLPDKVGDELLSLMTLASNNVVDTMTLCA